MARRGKSKAKHPRATGKTGITASQYTRLKKEAKNARERIRNFSNRSDSDNYKIPDTSLYTLNELLFRIESGESVKNVISELRGITSKSILQGGIDMSSSDYGFEMTRDQRNDLRAAVNLANKAIRDAKQKNPDFADVFPQEFSYSELSSTVVSENHLDNILSDLSKYTREGMDLTAVEGTGEAITKAELARLERILTTENERRAGQREQEAIQANNPDLFEGFLRSQQRYDTQPIKIDELNLSTLRKRAGTWDDPARTYRANMFLHNYDKSLNEFSGQMIINGYSTEDFQIRVNHIQEIIGKLYNNEEAITYISKYMPNLNIAIISGRIVSADSDAAFDFNELYYDWLRIEDEWL